MGKVIAFIGSPRKEGFSRMLMDELFRGVESVGGEVKTYDLNAPGFRGCQGCYYCRTHESCIVQDLLQPFYTEVDEAAGLVISSPIYFGDVSGQVKMWLDRMFPMLDGKSLAPRHPGKKITSIWAQGDNDAERFSSAMTRFHGFFRTFGWRLQDSIVCGGASNVGFTMPSALMKRAFEAGMALAKGEA